MKILKNNLDKSKEATKEQHIIPFPRKLICEECHSELEYDKSDLRIGINGYTFVDCPICGRDNILDDDEYSITLTADNIEFPAHFYHVSTKKIGETKTNDRCNTDVIREEVRNAIKYFRKNKNENAWYSWCGNLLVIVYRWSGDEQYEVFVSKDFYNVDIPFESDDYEF